MQSISVQMLDDIDSTVITEEDGGGTVQFGLDDTSYDIDLTQEHATALRELLAPYVSAGRRRTKDGKSASATRGVSVKSDKAELVAIRAWAAKNDIAVSGRGRISASVREAYTVRTS